MDIVTGGSGFIGTHLCRALAQENGKKGKSEASILNIDIQPPIEKKESIAEHLNLDIRNFPALLSAFQESKPDWVFHLAAQTSVPQSIADPLLDYSTNALGTANVLEACRKTDAQGIVYASSAAIYGEPAHVPVDETHPTRPSSPYGHSKLAGDRLCEEYAHTYGLRTVRLRFFNVYGPTSARFSPYAGVMRHFSKMLADGQPISIEGDGSQTRDFIHVSDIVSAMMRVRTQKKAWGNAYNLGTGREVSILQLAEMMSSVFASNISASAPKKSKPIFKPARKGDIARSVASIEAAKKDWAFSPSVKLEEGLKGLF